MVKAGSMKKFEPQDVADQYVAMYSAAREQNRVNGRSTYLRSVRRVAECLNEAAREGDFEDCLAIIRATQEFDLANLAKNDRERATLEAYRDDRQTGENHYATLKNRPGIYRKYVASGFIRSDRAANGTVPKDGMRKALGRYARHLAARYSMLISDEESLLVSAQITLVTRMLVCYTLMQKRAVAPKGKTP